MFGGKHGERGTYAVVAFHRFDQLIGSGIIVGLIVEIWLEFWLRVALPAQGIQTQVARDREDP